MRRREFLVAATAPLALSALGVGRHVEAVEANTRTPLIVVFLSGGISAKEFTNPDPPNSPAELRGPLGSVATRSPGVHFSECWPGLAARTDKVAVLRAIDAGSPDHTPGMQTAVLDGNKTISERIGERAAGAGVPYVVLNPGRTWHGLRDAFRIDHSFSPRWDDGRFLPPQLAPAGNLVERRRLLEAFDAPVPSPVSARIHRFRETAFDLLMGGGRFFEALDLPADDRRRYGENLSGDMVLLAKRFVERGAGAVTVYHEPGFAGWDNHTQIGQTTRDNAPEVDSAVSVLIDEIASNRLNATLLMMGEINRTPRVNGGGGRDHWQHGNQAILAGPRIRPGVHGRTNPRGEMVDGAVRQRDGLQNTVLYACGEEISPALPRAREVLR